MCCAAFTGPIKDSQREVCLALVAVVMLAKVLGREQSEDASLFVS